MEEFHGSSGAMTGPEDQDAPAPLDAGRLGGFLCQLQRKRFDGVLHIVSGEHSAAIGFREGTPVTFDDPTPGHTLAEQLIERGQLTRAQGNSVLARMTDGLVEDETVAFFEHAVQLGFLTDDEANVELSSRVRARLIQLFAWRDCETTLEAGRAALLDRREFPQNLGAILYMGVRTFYEEDFLTKVTPDPANTFVRLTAAPATVSHHFGLDDEEFQLLRRIHPDQSLSQLFQDPRVDRVLVLSLVLLMRLSRLCEVSLGPFAPKTSPRTPFVKQREPRGHDPRAEPSPKRGKTGSGVGRLPEAPESRAQRPKTGSGVGPLPEGPEHGRGKTGSRVGPLPEGSRAGSRVGPLPPSPQAPDSHAPHGRAGSRVGPLPEGPEPDPLRRGKAGSQAGPLPEPHAPAPLRGKAGASVGPLPEPVEPYAFGSSRASAGSPPNAFEQSSSRGKAGSSVGPLPDPPAPRPTAKPSVDATQEALLEAAARTARLRRSMPARRNSKQAEALPSAAADSSNRQSPAATASSRSSTDTPAVNRQATSRSATNTPAQSATGQRPAAASGGRSPSDAPANTNQKNAQPDPRADYAKAHLKELIARRKQAVDSTETSNTAGRDSARELREARSLLHSQHYSRAEQILAALMESEPQNELYRTFYLWAHWRAQPEAGEGSLDELQELAKKLLTQSEHAAFAAYALGHVFFHTKRDDLAEKFFKRAHAADRTNKDAERHLLILERRKHAAAEGGAGANRKLFGIQLPNSKPKP